MFRLALANFYHHKSRFFLVALALVLATGLLATVLFLSTTLAVGAQNYLDKAFNDQIDLIITDGQNSLLGDQAQFGDNNRVDITVTPEGDDQSLVEDQPPAQIQQLNSSAVATLNQLPGVEEAVGLAVYPDSDSQTRIRLILPDINQPSQINYIAGWQPQTSLQVVNLTDGSRQPVADDEIIVSARLANRFRLEIGDQLIVQTFNPDQKLDFTIVGFSGLGSNKTDLFNNIFDVQPVVSNAGLKRLGYQSTDYSQIIVSLQDDIKPEKYVANLDPNLIDDRFSVVVPAVGLKFIKNTVSLIASWARNILIFFISLGVVVGLFVVKNTFFVILAQRSRELALLRIVGASRTQVFKLVLIEAVLVGLLSAVLGVVVGAGLTFAVLALVSLWLGFAIPTGGLIITFWSLVMIFALGVTSSVGASVLPAFKTCRWSPLAALTNFAQIKTQNLLWRSLIGGLGFTGGLLGAWALINRGSGFAWLMPLIMAMLAGVILLTPFLARLFSRIGSFGAGLFGNLPLKLAANSIRRQPRLASTTANALLIGTTLIVLVSVLNNSFKHQSTQLVDGLADVDWTFFTTQLPDIEASSGSGSSRQPGMGQTGLDQTILAQLEQLDSLEHIQPYYYSHDFVLITQTKSPPVVWDAFLPPPRQGVTLDSKTGMIGLDPGLIDHSYSYNWSPGVADNLARGQIAVSDNLLRRIQLRIGDDIEIKFRDRDEVITYQIGGTFQDLERVDLVLATDEFLERLTNYDLLFVTAQTKPNFNDHLVADQINQVLLDYDVLIRGKSDAISAIETFFKIITNIFRSLLASALLFAVIGIFNTLFLSVVERTREIGVLRAVGLTRSQTWTMFSYEACLMSLFGVVGGLALGLIWCQLLVTLINAQTEVIEQAQLSLVIPYHELLVYCLVSIVVAIIVSIWPAKRAASLDIVNAIGRF